MNLIDIVAVLAIAQFFAFGVLVGRARAKYGVKAPAVTGHEMFERAFRVQMNTLEQLVCFLPALYLAAQYASDLWVAALGVVYLVGRLVYWRSYVANPAGRGLGFILTVLPTTILLVMALWGAVTGDVMGDMMGDVAAAGV